METLEIDIISVIMMFQSDETTLEPDDDWNEIYFQSIHTAIISYFATELLETWLVELYSVPLIVRPSFFHISTVDCHWTFNQAVSFAGKAFQIDHAKLRGPDRLHGVQTIEVQEKLHYTTLKKQNTKSHDEIRGKFVA